MNKKQITSKLKSQSGITAGEVIVALLIILSTLGVISMLYTNLVIGARGIDRKTGATRIATNIIENMDMTYYDKIEESLAGKASFDGNKYSIDGNDGIKIFDTTIPEGYRVEITIKNVDNSVQYDILKEVQVTVNYALNEQNQSVNLSRIIDREVIRECNSPSFEKEYLEQMGISNEDSIRSFENPADVADDVTIICPVKYDGENYKIITDENELKTMWYSYSNKQWARVLLLNSAEYRDCMSEPSHIVAKLKDEQKSYLWLPRFGVLNAGNLLEDTYFKYKNTEFAILNSYYHETKGNLLYYYLELKDWSDGNEITFDHNELIGSWVPYAELTDGNSDAYKLNHSKYGPLLEY